MLICAITLLCCAFHVAGCFVIGYMQLFGFSRGYAGIISLVCGLCLTNCLGLTGCWRLLWWPVFY